MLRICGRSLYGWECDHESMKETNAALDDWDDWDDYPKSWPCTAGDPDPPGVMAINADIRKRATDRWVRICEDLKSAGPYYPRQEVREALSYWDLIPEESLSDRERRMFSDHP